MSHFVCVECGNSPVGAIRSVISTFTHGPRRNDSVGRMSPGRYHTTYDENRFDSFWCGPLRPRNDGDDYVQWAEQGGWQ